MNTEIEVKRQENVKRGYITMVEISDRKEVMYKPKKLQYNANRGSY